MRVQRVVTSRGDVHVNNLVFSGPALQWRPGQRVVLDDLGVDGSPKLLALFADGTESTVEVVPAQRCSFTPQAAGRFERLLRARRRAK